MIIVEKNPNIDLLLVMGPSHTSTLYMKEDLGQKKFMEDLLLFVAKSYMPIFVVENQWLRHMVLHQNP
jgi:hypothetical protein